MRVTVLLCDHAEVADGKLFINGGGWDQISPTGGAPTGLAIIIHVPWDMTNIPKILRVSLVDQDSRPVAQRSPEGERPVRVDVNFEVGRPPGMQHGGEVGVPVALNFSPLALLPGSGYVWLLELDDHEIGRATFRTTPAAQTSSV
jgi:hypothetical protein